MANHLSTYSSNQCARHTPSRGPTAQCGSTHAAFEDLQDHGSRADSLTCVNVGPEDSDDDLQPPPQFSNLTTLVLEGRDVNESPKQSIKASKLRISRNSPSSPSPKDTAVPPRTIWAKRVGLQGAPVRRTRRTPQSEEQVRGQLKHERSPELDQENVPGSILRPTAEIRTATHDSGSVIKPESVERMSVTRDGQEKPAPLTQVSGNTPHRPAPPPPPRMSILEAATKAAGASTTKRRPAKEKFVVNGISYVRVEKCGKGGSADVHRVMAENGKSFALKRVKLAGADAATVAGFKEEVELLKKLQDSERVVRLYDHSIDGEKRCLYMLMELGEGDLSRVLSNKLEHLSTVVSSSTPETAPNNRLDFAFIRYWWKEMLSCVKSVHDNAIIHADLKPANFLVVKGSLKLIDFGIAGAIDIENTVNMHRDTQVGTPNYMSPESLEYIKLYAQTTSVSPGEVRRRTKIGKPSDVWSLGCILYQMVYGHTPFAHIRPYIPKMLAIIDPAVSISFPSLGLGGSEIPQELRQTLRNCLERDPSKRPAIADLLASDNAWLHPEAAKDLHIPEHHLDQIIRAITCRFKDKSKPPPTDDEINKYAPSFYARIREWTEGG